MAYALCSKIESTFITATQWYNVILSAFEDNESLSQAIRKDIEQIKDKDPACVGYSHPLLYLKGFHGVTLYRIANNLLKTGQEQLAFALQSRISEVFAMDLHPASKIGLGVMFDHATGIVIGETATVGDGCSIFHNVTLGGTGD